MLCILILFIIRQTNIYIIFTARERVYVAVHSLLSKVCANKKCYSFAVASHL